MHNDQPLTHFLKKLSLIVLPRDPPHTLSSISRVGSLYTSKFLLFLFFPIFSVVTLPYYLLILIIYRPIMLIERYINS